MLQSVYNLSHRFEFFYIIQIFVYKYLLEMHKFRPFKNAILNMEYYYKKFIMSMKLNATLN
jgi:hypothetical protein